MKKSCKIKMVKEVNSSTFNLVSIFFENKDKTLGEEITLFTLIPILREHNEQLLNSKIIEKMREVENYLKAEQHKKFHGNSLLSALKQTRTFSFCNFLPLLQGAGTNKLSQIITHSILPSIDSYIGAATIALED